jgi:hypothetical protein
VARKARNVNLSNESDVDAWDIFVRSKGEADEASQTVAYYIFSSFSAGHILPKLEKGARREKVHSS